MAERADAVDHKFLSDLSIVIVSHFVYKTIDIVAARFPMLHIFLTQSLHLRHKDLHNFHVLHA